MCSTRLALTGLHLAVLLGPLLVAAVALHQLNVLTTRVMWGTFGKSSVVWFTGWLGTPVHELSHAFACVVFRHRIKELVLFRPDPRTDVVGYVHYTWSPRDPWALLGHGFVGIAPLFGGAAVLCVLLFALAPSDVVGALLEVRFTTDPTAFGRQLERMVQSVQIALGSLASWSLLQRPTTWLLAYLTLCVGTHLAPSGPDLKGAWPSLLGLTGLLALLDLGAVLWLDDAGTRWVIGASSLMVPVVAVLAMAATLVAVALVAMWLTATLVSAFTRRGVMGPIRDVLHEPWRLLVVGVVAIAALALA